MHASIIELIHQPKRTNDGRDSLCNCDEARFKIYLISHKPNVLKNRDNYKEPQHQNLLAKSDSGDTTKKALDLLRKKISKNSSKIGPKCLCIEVAQKKIMFEHPPQ